MPNTEHIINPEDYNPYEERLIRVLRMFKRPLTTMQISEFTKISYNATKHNLDKLLGKKNVLRISPLGSNRLYWCSFEGTAEEHKKAMDAISSEMINEYIKRGKKERSVYEVISEILNTELEKKDETVLLSKKI